VIRSFVIPYTFSVIICAYTEERWNDLSSCVASIRNQECKPLEIILVIDHNKVLWERARTCFTDLLVLDNAYPQGASAARNYAIEHARGDLLAFIDDDAAAAPDWLKQLAHEYDDPAVMGVGGRVLPHWDTGRPAWFPEEFDWVVGCTYRGLPDVKAPVRNLICCNMSLRREVIDAVGGFQVGIGHRNGVPRGDEETELCIRARQHLPNRILIYEPAAVVLHRILRFRTTLKYYLTRCYLEGRSKAVLTELVGSSEGLSSEKAYLLHTLPGGVLRGIWHFITKFEPAGLGRACAIVAGFLTTAFAYIVGRLLNLFRPSIGLSTISSSIGARVSRSKV